MAKISHINNKFIKRKINGIQFEPKIFESNRIKTIKNKKIEIGNCTLEFFGEIPLRILSIPEKDIYVLYNFYPETVGFKFTTKDGSFRKDKFKGKAVFRYDDGIWESEYYTIE